MAIRRRRMVLNSPAKLRYLGLFVPDFRSRNTVIRFGEFDLDHAAGELRRDGARVRLQEQPLQVLQILLENPGQVIPREELQRRIWPSDIFVDFDHGINNAIKRLREALGDTAETPRYIETLPRRGYRFKATIEGVPAKSPNGSAPIDSIAIFPLETASSDPDTEYLAIGIPGASFTLYPSFPTCGLSRGGARKAKRAGRKILWPLAANLECEPC